MPEIILNRQSHDYTVDGIVKPSVTQVLKDQGILVISDFSTGPETGKMVHEATEAVDLGLYNAADWPEIVWPYIDAYLAFKEAVSFEPRGVEQLLYNEAYGYCGTLDRTGLLKGKPALVDFKTGVPNVATTVQIAAYWMAHSQRDKLTCYSLYLKADGKYKLDKIKPGDLMVAWNRFLSALNTYQFRATNGLI
jgi:hypothetical protein